jgi:hypothetical protein
MKLIVTGERDDVHDGCMNGKSCVNTIDAGDKRQYSSTIPLLPQELELELVLELGRCWNPELGWAAGAGMGWNGSWNESWDGTGAGTGAVPEQELIPVQRGRELLYHYDYFHPHGMAHELAPGVGTGAGT